MKRGTLLLIVLLIGILCGVLFTNFDNYIRSFI